jgi:ubiquinone/menaquinone biosynthesis C-methylase UbiE
MIGAWVTSGPGLANPGAPGMTDFQRFAENERLGWARSDIADAYNARFGALARQVAETLLDMAQVSAGSVLLDLCCGEGALAAAAQARGAAVTALDFSPHMVALARQRAPGAQVVEGDALALPFEADSFDVVLSNFGIQHTPDHPRAFAGVRRVLRPGGVFGMTCWDARGSDAAFGLILRVLKETADFSTPPPPQPGLFDFAERKVAAAGLQRHGLRLRAHRVVPLEWQLDRPAAFLENFVLGTVGVRMLIEGQPEAALRRIAARAEQEVATRFAAGPAFRVPVPAAAMVATLA